MKKQCIPKPILPRLYRSIEASPLPQSDHFALRPSTVGHCSRKLAYDLASQLGYIDIPKENLGARILNLFSLGHAIEEDVIKTFREHSKEIGVQLLYEQQEISFNNFPIKDKLIGHIDFLLKYKEGRRVVNTIVDVKSAKDRFSSWFNTKWDRTIHRFAQMEFIRSLDTTGNSWYIGNLSKFLYELYDPFFSDNFHQLNLYCCSEWAEKKKVKYGMIYRYNKNDSRVLEIFFTPDKELAKKDLEKLCNIYKTVIKKRDPEQVSRPYALGNVRCAYCPYRKTCWKDSDAQKEFLSKFIKGGKVASYKNKKYKNFIDKLTNLWETSNKMNNNLKQMKEVVLSWMLEHNIKRLVVDDVRCFEIVFRKSPKPHYKLVEGKL